MEKKKYTPKSNKEKNKNRINSTSYEIIVIGTSWGGVNALRAIFSALPNQFPVPIAVVQHLKKDTNETIIDQLQKGCALPMIFVEDKQPIQPGCIYIAPPDYHLLVEYGHFALSTEDPILYSRPSIDVLFESAADTYGEKVIGVILTGANQDGSIGLAAVKRHGGMCIVQNPVTAEMRTMPEAAIAAVQVDKILQLEEIGPFLVELCR